MARTLNGAVVVVTGASSGIGRATALEFARRGANVVVAARRDLALAEVAREAEGLGARALAVPTDVTDEPAVRELARRAVETFGRIDVWVNNAAVSLFGRFEDTPSAPYRRVIETNLFGYIHGARAVLPFFRQQGSGTLINNASMLGKVGAPDLSAYSVSKFGIVSLGESLRQELMDEPGIDVCTIMPASIDTPLFHQTANYTGRATKPLNPIYDADVVARSIVGCAERPRREVFVGSVGPMLTATRRLSPRLYEQMYARQVELDHFQDQPAAHHDGNLFEPTPEHTGVSGGWKRPGAGQAPMAPLAVAGAAVAAVGLTGLLRRRSTGTRS